MSSSSSVIELIKNAHNYTNQDGIYYEIRDIIEKRLSGVLTSEIAVSIQYDQYEIFTYLLDNYITDSDSFIDYKLRTVYTEPQIFIYIVIKYYNSQKSDSKFRYIKYLVENKAILIPDSAIYIASKNGHLELVKYLFINGGHILQKSILVAAENSHFDIVHFLIDKINKTDLNPKIIDNIFIKGPESLIKYIFNLQLKKSLKIDKNSLRYLFEKGRFDIIKNLLESSIPLIDIGPYAVRDSYENKHYDLVYFLLKQRFPVDITNDFIIDAEKKLLTEGIFVNNVEYF